jgi:Domain of unknown function (DUF4430)
VFRRSLILVAAAILIGAPSAGATVLAKIRVEGWTRTIFGPTNPRVSATNALDALTNAGKAGEFFVHVTSTSFGPYVDQVGFYEAFGSSGWAYKVNGVSPPVGADQYALKPGDKVLWYWAFFGLKGGPPTLDLTLAQREGSCYRVYSVDDQGTRTAALGAVLHVDGRAVKTQGATQAAVGCVGPHRGLVKATLKGEVRSNAVA